MMSPQYEILGACMGADVRSILPAAAGALGEIFQKGAAIKEGYDQLKRTIDADNAARGALGQALYTKSSLDAQAADVALDHAASEAKGLGPDSQKKRLDAARQAVTSAEKDYQAKAKAGGEATKSAVAYLQAAQQVATRAANAEMVSAGETGKTSTTPYTAPSQGFLTRPVLGPIPGWGVLAAGIGAAVLFWRRS